MNIYPLSSYSHEAQFELCVKNCILCIVSYYFYLYCFTVLITPSSSIYSHALYCINSRQCKFITTLAIVAPRYVTNCLYVVLYCTTFHDYGYSK